MNKSLSSDNEPLISSLIDISSMVSFRSFLFCIYYTFTSILFWISYDLLIISFFIFSTHSMNSSLLSNGPLNKFMFIIFNSYFKSSLFILLASLTVKLIFLFFCKSCNFYWKRILGLWLLFWFKSTISYCAYLRSNNGIFYLLIILFLFDCSDAIFIF